ncbi:MAG: hypothetical protein ACUVQG_00195 [Thermogutta sp.]
MIQTLLIGTSAVLGSDEGSLVSGDAFWQRLDRVTGIFWTDVPLREGLLRLGRTHEVAVLLDRRCDPDQEVTLTVRDRSLREVISAIARSCGYEAVFISPLIYVGPGDLVGRLESTMAARRQEALKIGDAGLAGLHPKSVSWPRPSTPRQLVALWVQEAHWELTNPEAILHDLWPAATLPPMTVVDRLSLVLFQFDQTFELSESGKITIVPLKDSAETGRQFFVGPRARILAQQWQKMFPDCQISAVGHEVIVQGPKEALERLAELLKVQNAPAAPRSSWESEGPSSGTDIKDPYEQRRFTVREGSGTLEGVIHQLAQQLDMQIEFDRQAAIKAGIQLGQQIHFQVQNGTIDQLWKAILDPHGLTFQRNGRVIRIHPKNEITEPKSRSTVRGFDMTFNYRDASR